MARARYLKPTFFTNERVGDLEPIERLVWAGLWCQADREGRLKDRPRELKLSVAPYDDVDIDAVLDKLMTAGFILRYEAEGRRYIYLPSFVEHQHPHPKEAPSVIPPPPPVPVLEIPERAVKAAGTSSESRNESRLTESLTLTESESESESECYAPLARRSPKPRAVLKVLTEDQRVAILADFADIPSLREEMEFALNHTAHDKCKDENLYLRHWLRGSRERLNTNGRNGSGTTRGYSGKRHPTGDEINDSWARWELEQFGPGGSPAGRAYEPPE